MFDFLLSGEWWMEALSVAIISAGAAIASAIISAVVSTRKMNTTLTVHDVNSAHNKELLSKEHQSLSSEHQSLSKENLGLEKQVSSVISGITYLREEHLKEVARQDSLKGQVLDMEQTIRLLSAHQRLLSEYESELQALRAKVKDQEKEIDALRHSKKPLQREQDDELEM